MPHPNNINRLKSVRTELDESEKPTMNESLRRTLKNAIMESERDKGSTLISSNTLANKYVYERWAIRASQRKRYRNLFQQVRRQARTIFRQYLESGYLTLKHKSRDLTFGVYKFDEKRGNLILGFVKMPHDAERHSFPAS